MSSSQEATGGPLSGHPWEVVVERGKIAEFADAMGSDNPAYRGPDAMIPPTFLTTAARWAPPGSRVSVGFDRKRLLHGGQEYVFHTAPPRSGDILTAHERIVERAEHLPYLRVVFCHAAQVRPDRSELVCHVLGWRLSD